MRGAPLATRHASLSRVTPTDGMKVEPRELTDAERSFVQGLLEHAGLGNSCFVAGLDDLRVTERCDCGCPSVFFAPAATLVHPEVGNSPLVEASAVTTNGVPVGVILWANGSVISGLELYSNAAAPPYTLPEPDTIDHAPPRGAVAETWPWIHH